MKNAPETTPSPFDFIPSLISPVTATLTRNRAVKCGRR